MIIKRKNYVLELDDETGNIVSFKGVTGFDYIAAGAPLFTLSVLGENGERKFLKSGKAAKITERGRKIEIIYDEIGGEPISAVAKINVSDETFVKFRAEINRVNGYRLEAVRYPGVTIKNLLSTDGYKLFWPAMEGVEITDVNMRTELMSHADGTVFPAKGWQGVYPGACPMQFMAYYNGVHGMYFASHDDKCNFKLIEWMPNENGIELLQQVYADNYESDFVYDYDVVLGAITGDWYTAAEIYRNFAENSKILDFPKLKDNENLPKWLFEPLTVITFPVRGYKDTGEMNPNCYYPYTNCLPYIEKYEKYFSNRQMVLLMHWEGTAPWAPPYVWPPFGDKANFDKLVDGVHSCDNLIGLYCSGLGWTQKSYYYDYDKTEDFEKENIAECIEIAPSGKAEYTTTCFHIRQGYELCPAAEKTKRIAEEEAKKIANETDVDYLQFFDQDLGGNTYPCYSDKHGHPPVPGKWMAKETADIVEKMRRYFNEKRGDNEMIIGCEAAACEPLLNNLRFNDLRYNLDLMYGVPVPAYNYVFGEYVQNYMGNHTTATRLLDTKLYPDNVFYRTAYSFAQGDILTFMLKNDGKVNWEWNVEWNDDNEPDQKEYLAFSKNLNDYRNGILFNALRYGKMVKPVKTVCGKYIEKIERKTLVRVYDEIVSTRFLCDDGDYQILVNFNSREAVVTLKGDIKGKLFKNPNDAGEEINVSDMEVIIPAHTAYVLKIEE